MTTSAREPAVPAAPDVPDAGPAWVQRAERWLRYDSGVRQVIIVVAVAAVGFSVVRTADVRGLRAVAYVLVAGNVLVASTRVLPAAVMRRVPTLPLFVVGAVLAAGVLTVDRTGATALFAYFLAGSAGFRLPTGRAFTIASLTATLCVVGILVGDALNWIDTPWYVGALTGTTVLIGTANRSRTLAEAAMRSAAESRVEAAEAESRAQTMTERARIARDVHDVLAHSLAGINMQLEVVDALLENGDTAAARAAALRAQHQVREGMAEVSRTVHTLRENALPLVDTLASLVEAAAPPGTVMAVVGTKRDVPTPQATALARVAQESLTNAHKHAPHAKVRVTLTFAATATTLEILNGASSGPSALTGTGSGLGLVGMRERIEIVGGTVQTGPVTEGDDAGGWRVHVEVPA